MLFFALGFLTSILFFLIVRFGGMVILRRAVGNMECF